MNKKHYLVLTIILFAAVAITTVFIIQRPGKAAFTCGDTITTDLTLTGDIDCSGVTFTGGIIIGADNITIDGAGYSIIGDGTMVGVTASGFDNITIKNLHIHNYYRGIDLDTSIGSTIQDNVITNDIHYEVSSIGTMGMWLTNCTTPSITGNQMSDLVTGIRVDTSTNASIVNNTASKNAGVGIFVGNSTGSVLTGNTVKFSTYGGMWFVSAPSTLNNNIFLFNEYDLWGDAGNTYVNNQFNHNLGSAMINFSDIARNKNIGNTVNFSFDMRDPYANLCPACTYNLTTSPAETVNSVQIGSTVNADFVVNSEGIYSLQIIINDGSGNTMKRNLVFLVGPTSTETTRYYFRNIDPLHGQPKAKDTRAMLTSVPTSTETISCDTWAQAWIDELPNFPISYITEENLSAWYKMIATGNIAIERFGVYGHTTFDYNTPVAVSDPDYSFINHNFTGLNWPMDYPFSWYFLTFKLNGDVPMNSWPFWRSEPANPSSVDITHVYPNLIQVKSLSNPEIFLVSAYNPTAIVTRLTVEGTGDTNITLNNFNKPFNNYPTRIYPDGSSTLMITGLAGQTPIDSVNMNITPDTAPIDASIDTWHTAFDYYKKWTEEGSSHNIITQHTIGSFAPNEYYTIVIDGIGHKTFQANGSGQLSFAYNGGFSVKTFEAIQARAIINEGSGLNLTEGSAPGTYQISLAKLPTSDVRIDFDYDAAQISISPANLNFTTTDWSTPQIVTVHALQDGIAEGNHSSLIKHLFTSLDPYYSHTYAPSVNVNINESVGSSNNSYGGQINFLINNDASTTDTQNVTLNIDAPTANTMRISNDPEFTDAEWEFVVNAKSWTLTAGEGEKTVYAQFKNASGGISNIVSDSIIFQASTVISPTPEQPTTTPVTPPAELQGLEREAYIISQGILADILKLNDAPQSTYLENLAFNKTVRVLFNGITPTDRRILDKINYFVAYGTPSTAYLGSGERLGVINSYKSAFNKLPDNFDEWLDVIKIANGNWPKARSEGAESFAQATFIKVYLRKPNMSDSFDNAAVTVMAYGLRPKPRNLNSERAAISSYHDIFKQFPTSATDWDTVRAIAYSGAKR
jgi:parallel beta-helix repeat protein